MPGLSTPEGRAERSPDVASIKQQAAPTLLTASTLERSWSGTPRRRGMWLVVVGLHLGIGWVLAQGLVRHGLHLKPEPVQVRLIEPPPPKVLPPEPIREVRLPLVVPVPLVPPPPITVAPPIVAVALNEPPPPPVPVKPTAVPAPTPPVVAAAPSAGPKMIPASAVRYLVEPRPHVPQMSRRLGESGLVVLRILVGVEGVLKTARIKTSSGFDRLDQQALIDIRSARFEPYLDNGRPVEWEADAGLEYEVGGGGGHGRHH